MIKVIAIIRMIIIGTSIAITSVVSFVSAFIKGSNARHRPVDTMFPPDMLDSNVNFPIHQLNIYL
jgi:hypothetical protein